MPARFSRADAESGLLRASTTDVAAGGRLGIKLTPSALVAAVLALALADWGSQLGGDSVVLGGPPDELAHVLTTLLVMWALGRAACERFLWPALIASVAIDLDHVPDRLGAGWLTAGTPRPYTHALLTIAVLVGAAVILRRRRDVLLGLALGLAIHFFRDMADSGVSLLWPLSDHGFTVPRAGYLGTLAVVALIDLMRIKPPHLPGSRSHRVPLPERSGSVHAASPHEQQWLRHETLSLGK